MTARLKEAAVKCRSSFVCYLYSCYQFVALLRSVDDDTIVQCVAKIPFYFCNNFIKLHCTLIIFDMQILK